MRKLMTVMLFACTAFAQEWREVPVVEKPAVRADLDVAKRTIATDGTNFMTTTLRHLESHDAGSRFQSSVTLLDANGKPIRDIPMPFRAGSVEWSGRYWLVLGTFNHARLDRDGTLLDVHDNPPGFIGEGSYNFNFLGVYVPSASDGGRTLAVYRINGEWDLGFLLFDEEGNIASRFTIDAITPSDDVQAVSNGAGRFAVSWYTPFASPVRRRLAIFSSEGHIINEEIVSNESGSMLLASDGETFALFPTNGTLASIYSSDGVLQKRMPIPGARLGTLIVHSAVGVRGSGYYVSGNVRNEREGIFLPRGVYEPMSSGRGLTRPLHDSISTATGVTALIGEDDVFIARSTSELLGGEPFAWQPLFLERGAQDLGAAATNAQGMTLIVWRERFRPTTAPPASIRAARVNAAGIVLDETPLLLGSNCDNGRPMVASDGRDFLVAWPDCTRLLASRVNARGEIVETLPLVLVDKQLSATSIAFDGTSYAIAWNEGANIMIARVSPGGTLLDAPPRTLGEGTNPILAPRDGGGFLLAFRRRFGGATAGHVAVQRLDAELHPVSDPVQVTANYNLVVPDAIERAGDRYLLTFSTPADERNQAMVGAQWLTLDGAKLELPGTLFFPAVATQPSLLPFGPRILPSCQGRDCTLTWMTRDRIMQAPMTDRGAGVQTVVVEGLGARAIHVRPGMLVYGRWDEASYRIFVRSANVGRSRAVRK